MTWTLQLGGHKANPDEEAELKERLREMVRDIRDNVDQELFQAMFAGSYGSENFLETLREENDSEEA